MRHSSPPAAAMVIGIWLALAVPAPAAVKAPAHLADPAALRQRARDAFMRWFQDHPAAATYAGLHKWDPYPPNFVPAARRERLNRARRLLREAGGAPPAAWPKDDQVDDAAYRALLEGEVFDLETFDRTRFDPSLPLEASIHGIFSNLVRETLPRPDRAKAAWWRLKGIPSSLDTVFRNLTHPEAYLGRRALRLAAAMDSITGDPMRGVWRGAPRDDLAQLRAAQENVAASLALFISALRARIPSMEPFHPLGRAAYEHFLNSVHLIPLTADQAQKIAQNELDRARAMMPEKDEKSARKPDLARGRSALLHGLAGMIRSLSSCIEEKKLLTLPAGLGGFEVREAPKAVGIVEPDGFLVPPTPFEDSTSGIFVLPPEGMEASSAYLRRALADPRLVLTAQAIPGRHLQASVAIRDADEIRRLFDDVVTVNGWSHYVEEMFLNQGCFDGEPEIRSAVIRLMRTRAARALVEIRLHAETWTLEQAVGFLADEEEIPLAQARDEAMEVANHPGEAMGYTIGKWQIRRLRDDFKAAKGDAYRLGAFHDLFLAQGRMPIALIEWAVLGSDASYRKALELSRADHTPPPAPGSLHRTRQGGP